LRIENIQQSVPKDQYAFTAFYTMFEIIFFEDFLQPDSSRKRSAVIKMKATAGHRRHQNPAKSFGPMVR